MRRRLILVAVVTALVGAVAAIPAAQAASAASKTASVKAVNYKFVKKTVTIRKGGKVTWRFKQGRHNVVGRRWSSPVKRSGTWSKRFKKRGKFNYRCTLHPGMDGRVRVR
jgi:plastocyanin